MKPYWEECRQSARKNMGRQRKAVISLNPHGDIKLNHAGWIAIERPTHVRLLYDAENKRIGIRSSYWADPNVFPVKIKWDHYGVGRKARCTIRAHRLLKQFNITIPETVRFLPPREEKDRIFALDLATAYVPEEVKKHWRRKKTAGSRM